MNVGVVILQLFHLEDLEVVVGQEVALQAVEVEVVEDFQVEEVREMELPMLLEVEVVHSLQVPQI
jgi:hypothetical protein